MFNTMEIQNLWQTISVSPMPPGWVAVIQTGRDLTAHTFPLLVVQRDALTAKPHSTRVVPATGSPYCGEIVALGGVGERVWCVVSAEDWALRQDEMREDLAICIENSLDRMVEALTAAGSTGISAGELVNDEDEDRETALCARELLVSRGLATTEWRADPESCVGESCFYMIAA